ncbi:MAG: ABC transporter substrate-binding protein, partial [Candidatus Bathyarchaeota archaeon]|nr:ABC transporter substrate-binding protein [Candidatus Termiticorpusculum sp.]
ILNLTSTINNKISTIPENQRKTVLLTNSPTLGYARAYVAIDTLGQACILAGGSNIANAFDSSTAYSVPLDTEYILKQNPQYIFLHTVNSNAPAQGMAVNDPTGMKNVLQEYVSQPAFTNLDAVKNNNVYMIASDFRNNAMGGTLGAVYMAKILYPDLLSGINPQSIHQDYITNYLHLNYNLDNSGVFIYPAITVNGDTVGIPNER